MIVYIKNNMKEKKNIIFSGNTAWGMYNFRGCLLKHFVSKGYNVYVTAPKDEVYFEKLASIGCTPVHMPVYSKSKNPFKDINLIYAYYKLIKRLSPDISITYTIKPNIYGSIAAQLNHARHLPITTGLGYTFLSNGIISKIAKTLYRFSFKRAENVWFLNKDDETIFKEQHLVNNEKIHLLYGEGVNLKHFAYIDRSGRTTSKIVFLYFGRLLYDKGLQEYVDAATNLRKKYAHAEFHMLGHLWKENPSAINEDTLNSWIEQGIIIYHGSSSDVRPFLAEADCAVLPSYREGMPCSLMEAASTGLPLITTDVPGCHEVVLDGHNGYLCKVKDASSLEQTMEKMINLDQKKRIELGKNGRKLMEEKFSIDNIIAQYDQFLGI